MGLTVNRQMAKKSTVKNGIFLPSNERDKISRQISFLIFLTNLFKFFKDFNSFFIFKQFFLTIFLDFLNFCNLFKFVSNSVFKIFLNNFFFKYEQNYIVLLKLTAKSVL